MSVNQNPSGNLQANKGNANGDLYVMGHGDTCLAVIRDEDIAVDEEFVLVDLSDTANFKHTLTGLIRLYSLTISAEMESDGTGTWILYIGVVTRCDVTNGDVDWILALDMETFVNATDDQTRLMEQFSWPNGLNLAVSGDASTYILTIEQSANDTDFQTDVNLDSPVGRAGVTGSPPGAGDLVARWDETADGATISFTITVEYTAE